MFFNEDSAAAELCWCQLSCLEGRNDASMGNWSCDNFLHLDRCGRDLLIANVDLYLYILTYWKPFEYFRDVSFTFIALTKSI